MLYNKLLIAKQGEAQMIRITLDEAQTAALEQLRLKRQSNIGERAYYVLLSSQGLSVNDIANRLNRNPHTIRQWLNRYLELGIKGLRTKHQSGRPAVKASRLDSELETLLSSPPSDYGYQSSGWQVNLLRDYFSKQDCHMCENTIIKALKKLGYVYKRFSKMTPKNIPTKGEKADLIEEMVEQLQAYNKDSTEILFADESHFSNQPYVARGWFKINEKKQ